METKVTAQPIIHQSSAPSRAFLKHFFAHTRSKTTATETAVQITEMTIVILLQPVKLLLYASPVSDVSAQSISPAAGDCWPSKVSSNVEKKKRKKENCQGCLCARVA